AERLKRNWIGIDITHLAVALMKHRLKDAFGKKVKYKVIGEPVSLPDAKTLAQENRYQFQWWALGLVGARPVELKKGADKGIDGQLYFHDEADNARGKTKQIVISVKSGKVSVKDVRDLHGVVEREKARIGVLISMAKPTKAMRTEAASAGFYKSPWGTSHPTLQILTIKDLLNGKQIDYPHSEGVNVTFNKAPKVKSATTVNQPHLFQKQDKQCNSGTIRNK
ncbi:MAG: restriction endonuclease, partial [Sedimentisphaerales bacterium]